MTNLFLPDPLPPGIMACLTPEQKRMLLDLQESKQIAIQKHKGAYGPLCVAELIQKERNGTNKSEPTAK